LQRWEWDLRANDLRCVDGHTLFEGYSGPVVAPGLYSVRVTAGSNTVSTEFEVLPDYRAPASDNELAAWVKMQGDIAATLEDVLAALKGARGAREQVQGLQSDYDDAQLDALASAAITAIDDWEAGITELRHETFEDEDAWVMKLDGQLRHLLDIVGGGGAPVTGGAVERHADLNAQWSQHKASLLQIGVEELQAVNAWARQQSVPHVQIPLP